MIADHALRETLNQSHSDCAAKYRVFRLNLIISIIFSPIYCISLANVIPTFIYTTKSKYHFRTFLSFTIRILYKISNKVNFQTGKLT